MKDATRAALVAGLAVLAVALAAATLNSTVTPESSGPIGAEGSGDGGNGGLAPPPQSEATPGETVDVPFLSEFLTILAGIALVMVIAYVIRYRRESLRLVLASIALVVALLVVLQVLSLSTGLPDQPPMENGTPTPFGGGAGGGTGGSDTTHPTPPSLILLLVLGLALLGAVVVFFGTASDDTDDSARESADESATVTAVGRAAGRAADRLEEESDVDNEVYRAWRELTALLDVDDPETSTPGEFARAAVEAGLGREDVEELTRLFEDVRYGDTQPTDDHERRAITVFRRIEDRYGGDES